MAGEKGQEGGGAGQVPQRRWGAAERLCPAAGDRAGLDRRERGGLTGGAPCSRQRGARQGGGHRRL